MAKDTRSQNRREDPRYQGMASKECKTSSHSTPDEAASDPPSELEEDNADPDSPEDKLFHTWFF